MVYQTEVQDTNGIRLGSCKFEAEAWPSDFLSMTNLGVLEGAELVLNRQVNKIVPDNSAEIPIGVQHPTVTITATLLEWTLETLELLGLGTVTDTAAEAVTGASHTEASGAWDYQEFIPVTSQPSASITSVTGSVDDALVEDTDYYVVTTEEGETGVVIIDSVDVTTKVQALTIVYGYTPNATKTIKIGAGMVSPSYMGVRLTNTNAAGKTLQYKVFKCQFDTTFKHTFQKDSDGKPAGIPITLTGYQDTTRDADDDLMEWVDTQAV